MTGEKARNLELAAGESYRENPHPPILLVKKPTTSTFPCAKMEMLDLQYARLPASQRAQVRAET